MHEPNVWSTVRFYDGPLVDVESQRSPHWQTAQLRRVTSVTVGDRSVRFIVGGCNGFAEDGATVLAVETGDGKSADVPAERVAFVAYLTGRPPFIDVSSEGFESDHLQNVVFGGGEFDSWNGESWERGTGTASSSWQSISSSKV